MDATKKTRTTTTAAGRPGYDAAVPTPVREKLKAERIQLALRGLPGWSLTRGGAAISRTFPVTASGARPLVAFAGFVFELAEDHGVGADLDVRSGGVTVTLSNSAARGLTMDEIDFARALELRG
jgi:pterin-4a-carbinolamine dehydratase